MMNNYADSWNPIMLSDGGTLNNRYLRHHPITLSIITQLSQDITQCGSVLGEDSLLTQYRDDWADFVEEAIYQSLVTNVGYLIIDFGDGNWDSDPVNWQPDQVTPLMVTDRIPTKSLVESGYSVGTELINENRYLKFVSPFRFSLAQVLDTELNKHDAITTGLEQTIAGQGLVKTGIDNLYDIMLKGGQALNNLTTRLINLKGATRQDGLIAYDRSRESVDVQMKNINREPEVLRVIENRITAITGLPSFLIWGHTDGDGYGVKTSLELYDQRLSSLSSGYRKLIQVILDIIDNSEGYRPSLSTRSIFPESATDIADRLDKTVSALLGLQSIGAMTAIEVRNTIDADPTIRLVLDPNPVIVSGTQTTATTSEQTGTQSGFSG